MKNIKLTVEYDGTAYYGWQRQKKLISIQRVLEDKISCMVQEKIKINGSGRTDAGVHAIGQVANFITDSNVPVEKIPFILNHLLPDDILIKKAEEVGRDFHARFSAIGKLYHYYVFEIAHDQYYPSFLLNKYVYCINKRVDIVKMKKASQVLLGENDFTSFACSGSSFVNPVRNLTRINIARNGRIVCFQMEANAFLYKMVRGIVGTLLEIGQGKIDSNRMNGILKAKDRREAGTTIPAKGLFLMRVKY